MITTVEQLLAAHPDTCDEARSWLAEKQITSLADAWDQCRRSDWMLWLDRRLDLLTDRQRRLIACKCVRETPLADGRVTWDLLTDERSRLALTAAERYAGGWWASAEELAAAADAADAAADAAWDAAMDAAAAARAAAAAAAAAAARAAAWAAADEAGAATMVRAWVWVDDAEARAAAKKIACKAAALAADAAAWLAEWTAGWAAPAPRMARARAAQAAAYAAQADIIRAIAGNPFRAS